MGRTRAATGRQLVVWLHVVSSVGWMSQAVALLALLGASAVAEPGATKEFGAWAAEYLDQHVLVYFANVSAFTGFLLAAATPWGFFRHWWVGAKFAITVAQLYAGIFVLSAALHDTVSAATAGVDGPVVAVATGAALMAGGLAFQTWLSVAKPWGRTPLARPGERGATAPAVVFAAGVGAPLVDVAAGMALGYPLPAVSLVVLVAALVVRARTGRVAPADPAQRVRSRAVSAASSRP